MRSMGCRELANDITLAILGIWVAIPFDMKATIKNTVTKEYWMKRHEDAMRSPKGSEVAIVMLVKGLEAYASHHADMYGSTMSNDGYLGPVWSTMVTGLHDLLNGDCGRLDCGTLSARIGALLTDNGFDSEGNAQ